MARPHADAFLAIVEWVLGLRGILDSLDRPGDTVPAGFDTLIRVLEVMELELKFGTGRDPRR